MFDVGQLIENQRQAIALCLKNKSPHATTLITKPTDLDDFVRKVFGNFPLKDSNSLVLSNMGGPRREFPLPQMIARPRKLRPVFGTANFTEEYMKALVSEIEHDLTYLSSPGDIYYFAMWIPIYMINSENRVMTSYGKKIVRGNGK